MDWDGQDDDTLWEGHFEDYYGLMLEGVYAPERVAEEFVRLMHEEEPCRIELKNTTKKLCVIGEPVLHSKSPVIQNAMIQALGLDYIYLCQPVPRGACRQWLELAAFAGYAGFNATMPHKQELVALMDELDEDGQALRRCEYGLPPGWAELTAITPTGRASSARWPTRRFFRRADGLWCWARAVRRKRWCSN